jgi:glycerol-1-phosphate dehydrogenase [NAD(P)+]
MREINNLDHYLSLNPSELADTVLHCPACGRDHTIPFQVVEAGDGLMETLPAIIERILGKQPEQIAVVYDRHIEEKLEDLVFPLFSKLSLPIFRVPLGEKGKLLDSEVGLGDRAAMELDHTPDLFIGVGSGVISDLTKWIATRKERPLILLGTAASMNAYTSITATMTEDHVKSSRWLNPADAVLLDTDLVASAPREMTCSGIGDLLARNVSNADWKASQLLRGTYFCPVPFRMMSPYQDFLLNEAGAMGRNEPEALEHLNEAILVSGYSMTVLDGHTSPSSGSEHVISHFFDFQHEVFGAPKNFHGTQVGVGTLIILTAYAMLREIDPRDLDVDDIERRRISLAGVNLDHQRVFGENGVIFNQVVVEKRIPDVEYRDYLVGILQNWESLWAALDPYLIPPETARSAMEAAGAVTTLNGIHRDADEAIQALLYGSHYRPRYTVLDLLWELGLFPTMASTILEASGVLA